jgi:hypothetical protein
VTAKILLTGGSAGAALGIVGGLGLANPPAAPRPIAVPTMAPPVTTTTLPPLHVVRRVYRPVIITVPVGAGAGSRPAPRPTTAARSSAPAAASSATAAPAPAPARRVAVTTTTVAS